MTMRILSTAVALIALVIPKTILAQANRFGATAAETRSYEAKIAILETDFAGLAARYRVPLLTLRAIARGQVRAFPTLGGAGLRETVRKLTEETAGLREQLAELRAAALKAPAGATRTRAAGAPALAAQLARASELIDQGELEPAGKILASIKPDASDARGSSRELWVELVKATALTQRLAGDFDGSDETLRVASEQAKIDSDNERWELLYERALRLNERGTDTQDMRVLAQSVAVLEDETLGLARQPRQQLRTLNILCSGKASLFSEGTALSQRSQSRSGLDRLIEVCEEATKVARRETADDPVQRSTALALNGVVLSIAYAVKRDERIRERSLADLTEGVAIIAKTDKRLEKGQALILYADALVTFGLIRRNMEQVDDGVRRYQQAVALISRHEYPATWAAASQRLGGALGGKADVDGQVATLQAAIDALQRAGEVFGRSFSDPAWARNTVLLAGPQLKLARKTGDVALLSAVLSDLRAAEAVLATSNLPAKYDEARELRRTIEGLVRKR